jgi:hypothetical protein
MLRRKRKNTENLCEMSGKERWILDKVKVKVKVKLSRYSPWRHMGGEEV